MPLDVTDREVLAEGDRQPLRLEVSRPERGGCTEHRTDREASHPGAWVESWVAVYYVRSASAARINISGTHISERAWAEK